MTIFKVLIIYFPFKYFATIIIIIIIIIIV